VNTSASRPPSAAPSRRSPRAAGGGRRRARARRPARPRPARRQDLRMSACPPARAAPSGARAWRPAPPAACPRAPPATGRGPGRRCPSGWPSPALERREAHRRVDERPSTTAAASARAEVAGDDPQPRGRPRSSAARATRRRARARGSRSGEVPALAPLAGQRVRRRAAGIVAWKAVSKQATAGTSGRAPLTASSAASDFGRAAGHAVDHVDHEVEAVEVVEHHHVERRRRGALLLVAAHVDVGVVRAPVGEPVDQPRVAVVGEDHRLVGREQRVELASTARAGARCRAAGASGRRR
jgi:hypothetical protein